MDFHKVEPPCKQSFCIGFGRCYTTKEDPIVGRELYEEALWFEQQIVLVTKEQHILNYFYHSVEGYHSGGY